MTTGCSGPELSGHEACRELPEPGRATVRDFLTHLTEVARRGGHH